MYIFFINLVLLNIIPVSSSNTILEVDIDILEITNQIIAASIGIFSLLLLLLSLYSYKRTGLKNILYAASAFGLFAIRLLVETVEDNFEILDSATTDIVFSAMTLGILILFFLAIIRKNH